MDERQMWEMQQMTDAGWEMQGAEVPKKNGIGKRIGYFFLSLTPAAASLAAQFMIAIVVIILVAVVAVVQFRMANPVATPEEALQVYNEAAQNAGVLSVFMYHLLALPIFGLWYYFGCGRPSIKKSVHNVSVKAIVIAVVSGAVLSFLSEALVGLESFVMPKMVESYVKMMETAGIGVTPLAIVATVLLAPIGEELVCRGLTLYYAEKSLPWFWAANVLQALLFAVMHLSFVQGSYAFLGGLMLGYVTKRFHSLIPAMVIHFVLNVFGSFVLDKVFVYIPGTLAACVILAAVAGAITLLLVWWGGSVKKQED